MRRISWSVLLLTGALVWASPASAQVPAEPTAEEVPAAAAEMAEEAGDAAGGEQAAAEMQAEIPAEEPAQASAEEPTGVMSQTAAAVKSGGAEVVEQGREIWTEALLPIWQRLLAAVPVVLKAMLLLAVFWLAAVLVGMGVRKGLDYTRIDERAARDLGLGEMLEPADKKPRSIAKMAGTAVKWIILAFGFLAFFNALQLDMVAGPLQNILGRITNAIPAVLKAAVILFAYWIVATLLKMGVTRGLGAVGFDERAEKYVAVREVKGDRVGPSAMLGRLVFYVVLLFAIPPFLDAVGQRALVSPLRDMLGKVLDFLPNLFVAVVLFFVGRIIATIIREVVANFLAAVGLDRFAERFGFGGGEEVKKLSEIGGAVAYFFVIIPILAIAVDALQMKAISDPVKSTLEQLMSAVPLIFLALVVLAIGYFIAKVVQGIVESFLKGVGFDALPERLGLDFLAPKEGGASLSTIAATVVMVIILLLTAEQALATLRLAELSALVGKLIHFLPSLVVGLVIILAALALGNYVGGLVGKALEGSSQAGLAAAIAKWAIVFLGFSMGLNQLGVGQEILTVAVSAILGGVALAMALAFGLGGRDRAKEIIEKKGTGV